MTPIIYFAAYLVVTGVVVGLGRMICSTLDCDPDDRFVCSAACGILWPIAIPVGIGLLLVVALGAAATALFCEEELRVVRDALHAAQLRSADLEAKLAVADSAVSELIVEKDNLLQLVVDKTSHVPGDQEAISGTAQVRADVDQPARDSMASVSDHPEPVLSMNELGLALGGQALEDMLVARVADRKLQDEVDSLKRKIGGLGHLRKSRSSVIARMNAQAKAEREDHRTRMEAAAREYERLVVALRAAQAAYFGERQRAQSLKRDLDAVTWRPE